MTTRAPTRRRWPAISSARHLLIAILIAGLSSLSFAADTTKKTYDVPAGDAIASLKRFSEQSGREIVYPADALKGVTTKPVKGQFTAMEAVNQMLAGSDLYVIQDEKTGALAVNKVPSPNGARAAQVEK